MNLLKAAATVSGFTLLSRITGLIRETLIATLFGASAATDAFFVAFRLPNMLRRLFAEGAFSQAFVPMLAERKLQAEQGDSEQARVFASRVATALFWSLLAVTMAGIFGAPLLVWLMAAGLEPSAEAAAILMTRWMFPYILLISLVALAAGILNTWKRFAVPAFTPVLLNVAMIAAALALSSRVDPPVLALAAGVMAGGVAQLALQWPALKRIGMLPSIGLNPFAAFADPDVRAIIVRMGPAVLAVSVAQVSLVVNTHIASRLAPGSVSWVSFGDRLMEFPTALLGVALGTVLLPSLARAGQRSDTGEYTSLLDWGLRLCVMLSIPGMVGLALMAEPLTALLFHYGRFDAHDVAMTRQAVLAYSVGLLGLIAVKVLAPGFYARQDIRTPVKIAVVVLVATQLMNLIFVPWLAHAGLALSISVAAWCNAALLLRGLLRNGTYQPAAGWGMFALKVLVAAAAMALLLVVSVPRFDWIGLQASPVLRAVLALSLVALAAATYLGALLLMGLRPRQFLRRD
ncbi:MAG: murein biosynthesis integral membrane protein MurJ [Betaproteobacteria bacterium]|nr:murein biosynthesis integral membrane protein MurJ [Betaproteobacteria bacterium]